MALVPLQMMLNNVGTIVLPQKVSISESYKKFNKEGKLTDTNSLQQLEKLVKDFIRITTAIKNSA